MALVLRDIPFQEVGTTLQQANLGWVLLSFVTISLALLARGVRWRGLLDDRLPLRDSMHIVNISFMMNLLPLRFGEVVRAALATRHDIPFLTAMTSIVVERLTDTLVSFLLLMIAVSQIPDVSPEVTAAASFLAVVAVIGFIVMIFFAQYPAIPHRILDIVFRIIPFLERLPLRNFLQQVLDGLKPLTDWRRLGMFLVWTAIAWFLSYISFVFLFNAMPIGDSDVIIGSLLAISLGAFSLALPATIAGVGAFEAAVRVAGDLVGINEVVAVSLGLLIHFMSTLGYVVWGIIGVLSLGVSFGELFARRDPDAPVDERELSVEEQ